MSDRTLSIDGVRVPRFLYGTAWKEDQTRRLTELALRAGLPRHRHRQPAPPLPRGRGRRRPSRRRSRAAWWPGRTCSCRPSSPSAAGRTTACPTTPRPPIRTQVEQSFASSLEHLGTEVIDSYLLHGPTQRAGLAAADWEAWRAMEALHDSGRARLLGVSNVTLEQLQRLCEQARVRPRFVQNRCYAARGWDRGVREFCAANGLVYQGFSLLTANREALARPELARIAARHGRTVSPGRLPVRPRRRHGAPDRHHRRRPHAGGPRRLRLPPGARRGRADRASGLAVNPRADPTTCGIDLQWTYDDDEPGIPASRVGSGRSDTTRRARIDVGLSYGRCSGHLPRQTGNA